MADLRELTTDAKRLYEALDDLMEKQESANAQDLDFKEIWFSAKARPFHTHILCKKEEDICKKYMVILAALVGLSKDAGKRTVQVRFLARLLAACENVSLDIRQIVTDGMMITEKSMDEIQEIKDEDLQISLLVDLFLMTYLDGQPDEKQLDFVIGIMAMLGLDREKAKAVGNVVKGLLEQNDELVMNQSCYINIGIVYCYMKNPPDGILVSDLEKAKTVEAEKIIFSGIEWKAISKINCDEYRAEKIEFVNCKFYGVQGIENRNKRVWLHECEFSHCDVEENLLTMKNTVIDNCKFIAIKSYDSKFQHLFQLLNCEVTEITFQDVTIQYNSSTPYGGLLKAKDCTIHDMTVLRLNTYASCYAGPSSLICVYGGRIFKCNFLECTLSSYSFLFTGDVSAVYSDLNVESFESDVFDWNDTKRRFYDPITIDDLFLGRKVKVGYEEI
jgi:hypothetical protein